MSWTQQEAIELCVRLEPVASAHRCHVALTGGLLYKEAPRKDCDIIVYFEGRKATDTEAKTFAECVNRDNLITAFWHACDLPPQDIYSRVVKCLYRGKSVDLIFPELDGEYRPEEHRASLDDKPLATSSTTHPEK